MKFNVNNYVKVKLTQVGIDELKRQHEELKAELPSLHAFNGPKTDKEGYSKFQLWSLMERLGHLCRPGCEPPFGTEIIILDRGKGDE